MNTKEIIANLPADRDRLTRAIDFLANGASKGGKVGRPKGDKGGNSRRAEP